MLPQEISNRIFYIFILLKNEQTGLKKQQVEKHEY